MGIRVQSYWDFGLNLEDLMAWLFGNFVYVHLEESCIVYLVY